MDGQPVLFAFCNFFSQETLRYYRCIFASIKILKVFHLEFSVTTLSISLIIG